MATLTSKYFEVGETLPCGLVEGVVVGVFPMSPPTNGRPTLKFIMRVNVPVQSAYAPPGKTAKYRLVITVLPGEHDGDDDTLTAADHAWLDGVAASHTARVELGGLRVTNVTFAEGRRVYVEAAGPRKIVVRGNERTLRRRKRKEEDHTAEWFYTPSPVPQTTISHSSPQHSPPPLRDADVHHAVPLAQKRSRSPRPLSMHALDPRLVRPSLKRPGEGQQHDGGKRVRIGPPPSEVPQAASSRAVEAPAPASVPAAQTTPRSAPTWATAPPPQSAPAPARQAPPPPSRRTLVNLSSEAEASAAPPPADTPARPLLPTPSTALSSRVESIDTPFTTQERDEGLEEGEIAVDSSGRSAARATGSSPVRHAWVTQSSSPVYRPAAPARSSPSRSSMSPVRVQTGVRERSSTPLDDVRRRSAADRQRREREAMERFRAQQAAAPGPASAQSGRAPAPRASPTRPEAPKSSVYAPNLPAADVEGCRAQGEQLGREPAADAERKRQRAELDEKDERRRAAEEKRRDEEERRQIAERRERDRAQLAESERAAAQRRQEEARKRAEAQQRAREESERAAAQEAREAAERRAAELRERESAEREAAQRKREEARKRAEELQRARDDAERAAAQAKRGDADALRAAREEEARRTRVPAPSVAQPQPQAPVDARRAAEERVRRANEARIAAQVAEREQRAMEAANLATSLTVDGRTYVPLDQMTFGQGRNIMGIIIKVHAIQPPKRGWHHSLTLIVADPSTHTDGGASDDRQVTIFGTQDALASARFHVGAPILLRNLKVQKWEDKPKGTLFPGPTTEWYILTGSSWNHGGEGPGHPLSAEEVDRLKALAAWWRSQGEAGAGGDDRRLSADNSGVARSGKDATLGEIIPGVFFNLTAKVLHVAEKRYISRDDPAYEIYVADGTVNRRPTYNFHGVQSGIDPRAVMCLSIFNEDDGDTLLYKEGAVLHFENVRSADRAGEIELKWSNLLTEAQTERKWRKRKVTLVAPDDERAVAIEKRYAELKRLHAAGVEAPTAAAPVRDASPARARPPPPVHDVSRQLATVHRDAVRHPTSTITDVRANNTVPNRFRVLARVAAIVPRGAKGSQPGDLAVLWCRKCNNSFGDTHCQSCNDTALKHVEVRYQMVLVLEPDTPAGDDDRLAVVFDGDEAAAVLPPLPLAHSGPNEIKRARTRISALTPSVEDMLLGRRFDGERSRPLIDWSIETYAGGPKNSLDYLLMRVFGMQKGET